MLHPIVDSKCRTTSRPRSWNLTAFTLIFLGLCAHLSATDTLIALSQDIRHHFPFSLVFSTHACNVLKIDTSFLILGFFSGTSISTPLSLHWLQKSSTRPACSTWSVSVGQLRGRRRDDSGLRSHRARIVLKCLQVKRFMVVEHMISIVDNRSFKIFDWLRMSWQRLFVVWDFLLSWMKHLEILTFRWTNCTWRWSEPLTEACLYLAVESSMCRTLNGNYNTSPFCCTMTMILWDIVLNCLLSSQRYVLDVSERFCENGFRVIIRNSVTT